MAGIVVNLHSKSQRLPFFKVIIHFKFLYEIGIQIVPNNFCATTLEKMIAVLIKADKVGRTGVCILYPFHNK